MTVEMQARVTSTPHSGVPAAALVTGRLKEGRWSTRVVGGRIGNVSVDGEFSGAVASGMPKWMDTSLAGSVLEFAEDEWTDP
jgi:hypothetical protein